jgi:NitT/TauT family transport system substrate-binding protein
MLMANFRQRMIQKSCRLFGPDHALKSMIQKSCRLFGPDHAPKSIIPKSCRLFGQDHAQRQTTIAATPAASRGAGGSARIATAGVITACLLAGNLMANRPASAQAPDHVSFATNWVAEGEHGGFYQALADGTYRRYGLDVTIVPGGPLANNRILLPAGKIDFYLSANTLQAFDAVEQNIPTLAVAAMFQKEPQVLIAHPGGGIDSLKDLKGRTLYVSKEGVASYFEWLKADFGFADAQVRPYTFNPQPFLADRNSAMQGYVTSEPYAIEKLTGMPPKVFLIADYGFNSYSTLIETRRDLVDRKPDLVQRFVDASIIGWYRYIYGDNRAGNDMIKRQNPEMTDELLAYTVARLKEYGIVDSGDSLELGIGAMTDARIADFFDKMVRVGVTRPTIDYRMSYTLRFVNRKVGIELRRN